MRDRDEHLAWCKANALAYLDRGEYTNAIASMANDLRQHPDLVGVCDKMEPIALFYVINGDIDGCRRWIEGFR